MNKTMNLNKDVFMSCNKNRRLLLGDTVVIVDPYPTDQPLNKNIITNVKPGWYDIYTKTNELADDKHPISIQLLVHVDTLVAEAFEPTDFDIQATSGLCGITDLQFYKDRIASNQISIERNIGRSNITYGAKPFEFNVGIFSQAIFSYTKKDKYTAGTRSENGQVVAIWLNLDTDIKTIMTHKDKCSTADATKMMQASDVIVSDVKTSKHIEIKHDASLAKRATLSMPILKRVKLEYANNVITRRAPDVNGMPFLTIVVDLADKKDKNLKTLNRFVRPDNIYAALQKYGIVCVTLSDIFEHFADIPAYVIDKTELDKIN